MESSDFRNPEGPQDEVVPNLQETQPHLVPIQNLPLPWCFRCKTFSHRVMDCRELRRDQNEMLVTKEVTTSDPPLDTWLLRLRHEFARDMGEESLCDRCKALDIANMFRLPFHPSGCVYEVANLGRASKVCFLSNCHFCKLLIASAPRFTPSYTSEILIHAALVPFLTTARVPTDGGALEAMLKRLGNLENYGQAIHLADDTRLNWLYDPGLRTGIAKLNTYKSNAAQHFIPLAVGPRPDYEMIKAWIQTCVDSHSGCAYSRVLQDISDIRLVDVQLRKVVEFNIDKSPEYIALSYVWGGVPQRSYPLGTTIVALPSGIEDAMLVVKKLGQRYLWVDSLCIDQNDEDHKASQIMKMDKIYKNAIATIINMSASSATMNLPGVRHDREILQQGVRLGSDYLVSTLPSLAAYVHQSPWSTRAWVFQEAMLSRRCLFFTQSQVYFECTTAQSSEVLGLNPLKSSALLTPEMTNAAFRFEYATELDDRDETTGLDRPLALYAYLVEAYKRRHLTYISDSLNAFKAITNELAARFESEFQYGLPVSEFWYALGWRQKQPRRRDPSFPNWSWAAYKGELLRAAIDPQTASSSDFDEGESMGCWPYFRLYEYRNGALVTVADRSCKRTIDITLGGAISISTDTD
jgi:hypothetical protein